MPYPDIPCPYCEGTGIKQGLTCSDCGGDGKKVPVGMHEKIYAYASDGQTRILTLETAVADILDKCNDIIAEQAAQRTDLTAALTQIWNKVKDL